MTTKKSVNRAYKAMVKLKKKPPKSELWFREKWGHFEDECFNRRFGVYVPDVISFLYKYVIEIDGSIHKKELIKLSDKKKDKYYKSHGFECFRVVAYDLESFYRAKNQIMFKRAQTCNKM